MARNGLAWVVERLRGRCARTLRAWPLFLLPVLPACSKGTEPDRQAERQIPPCTFANPVAPGADPWVVRKDGWYYFAESRGRAIHVHRSQKLSEIKSGAGTRVWEAPPVGWNAQHVWAPELHFIEGRWYIYYAAGRQGPPFIHQRSGVLQSVGDDPQGAYVDKGMLFTGEGPPESSENIWAIDLTVGEIGGALYAIWSGWEWNASTDRTPQHLYIARMRDPWTIAGPRVRISSPVEPWERGTELDLNEGPQLLSRGGAVFIIYSTRESWLRDYRLGQLRLHSATADPLSPESWTKSGPVFGGTDHVFGAGHASFTTSPDGKEDWIVYHSKTSPSPGWERVIRMQKFGWNADGSPSFGTPTPSGERVSLPSGECSG